MVLLLPLFQLTQLANLRSVNISRNAQSLNDIFKPPAEVKKKQPQNPETINIGFPELSRLYFEISRNSSICSGDNAFRVLLLLTDSEDTLVLNDFAAFRHFAKSSHCDYSVDGKCLAFRQRTHKITLFLGDVGKELYLLTRVRYFQNQHHTQGVKIASIGRQLFCLSIKRDRPLDFILPKRSLDKTLTHAHKSTVEITQPKCRYYRP